MTTKTHANGAVTVSFDCACGMKGDKTAGKDEATARANAAGICARHGIPNIEQSISRALARRREP